LDKRYTDSKRDDELLEALANGGFQVGALARLMFQSDDARAVEIAAVDQETQIAQTAAMLARENVTIFEATIRHDNLLIRADILVKRGTRIDLVEVKAKSWNPEEDTLIGKTERSNPIDPDWEPYVYDVAFQQHVLELAYPALMIHPWLMLVDKSRTVQGGNQVLKFDYRLAVTSYKTEAVKLQLWDRLPHGETEAVNVTLIKSTPEVSADTDYVREEKPKNLLRWDMTVEPNARGEKAPTVTYQYKMEYAKDTSIGNFLSK
ncbi:MAG: DUF4139 domain-containing protein, partial [Tepidisphaerales bacterium]